MINLHRATAKALSEGWIGLFVQEGKLWGYPNSAAVIPDVYPVNYDLRDIYPGSDYDGNRAAFVGYTTTAPVITLFIPGLDNCEIVINDMSLNQYRDYWGRNQVVGELSITHIAEDILHQLRDKLSQDLMSLNDCRISRDTDRAIEHLEITSLTISNRYPNRTTVILGVRQDVEPPRVVIPLRCPYSLNDITP